jgi:ABC-type Fe3+ transport system permease subunit
MKFGWIICGFIVHGTKVTWTAMAIGLVVAILYFRIFFRSWDDFRDAWSDFWRGLVRRQLAGRISFWIIISVGSGMLAYYQLPEWFPHVFGDIK